MQTILDCCRWVYNKTLELRKQIWEERQEPLSLYDTNKMLPAWKQEYPWLKDGHAQAMQNAQVRLDLAFQAFFRRVRVGEKPGYPRFRSKDRYDSFTYPQEKSNWRLLDNRRVQLSKIGDVKIKLHRPIEGKIKTLTVHRDALGNWWATFSCEIGLQALSAVPAIVGIDLGLEKFVTLSTGEQIDNPRFFRQEEKTLAKAQRRLSKCDKGTVERRKHKRVVNHVHQRIANRRMDFAHKLSRRLVNEFQMIVFEDLDIQDMQNGNWRSMNKSISDAAWNQLTRFTTYKAEWAGRSVVLVDPRNTSKMCSRCGQIVEKALSCRVHKCPHCHLEINRDLNASLNILARGLARMGSIPRSSPL
jgi:putative transposase